MARTHKKYWRVYVEGYDMSGYVRSVNELSADYSLVGENDPMLTEAVKGVMIGQVTVKAGPINSVMNNTTSGMHETFSGTGTRLVSVAIGDINAPAAGDPVFAWEFEQSSYKGDVGEDVPVTIDFSASALMSTMLYDQPWGVLLHANGAETAANSGTSDHDHGASTAFGGFMAYHLLSSDGALALKVQDADTDVDGSFSDLVTSGSIDASAAPVAGVVALGRTATVERYLRWQLALDTATTATFVISFHRATR